MGQASRKYWLCCDGGGTKLIALLIDENLEIVGRAIAGGVNPNFMPQERILENMERCVAAVTAGIDKTALQSCIVSMPSPHALLEGVLRGHKIAIPVHPIGEGRMGMLAGMGSDEGFVALSGTGSDVFYEGSAGSLSVGGWGLLLGDEGSGGHIGQRGLIAAIHAADGRGQPTVLQRAVLPWMGAAGDTLLPEHQSQLCAHIYEAASPRAVLASFVPVMARAASDGDPATIQLFSEAGRDLAHQMIALIHMVLAKDPHALRLPSTLCGGVWKASDIMFRSYCAAVREAFPDFQIQRPLFDAIAGGAVLVGRELGYTPQQSLARIRQSFAEYLYFPL